ncbi:hypothetical protein [Roseateles sp.]|uniref:hypothetical protein n=1 Tax=Roseateles sp. TaxID=1971397 RepID=UPI0031D8F63C
MATSGPKIRKPKVTNDLDKFITDREHAAARAITQALILGGSEASVFTPIDTGTLLNSQYRHVTKDAEGRIVGTVGYTAAYALPVHDPDHKQTFRRATAEKEFLKKGFEAAAENIEKVITGALKA